MASRFHCTGPIEVWVAIPTPGPGPTISAKTDNAFYLGTCEQHPITQGEIFYDEVPNDIAGTRQGLDKQYEGGSEIIILDLNRFDYTTMMLIESAPAYGRNVTDSGGNNDEYGFTNRLARGSYMQQNGLSFALWLYYTFFGTRVAAQYPLMPPGIFYPCCNLADDSTPKQGTKTQTKRLAVEANWLWNETAGTFFLKTSDIAYF